MMTAGDSREGRVVKGGVGARMRGPELLGILRDRIARQDLAPGAKLGEQEIAEQFHVPRSVVREVFSALEQRGLIERVPRRGAVVARLDVGQAMKLYEVREVLEGLCVRLAVQNTQPEDWQDLLALFEGPVATELADGDLGAYLAAYEQFRMRLAYAANNREVSLMLDSINDRVQVLIQRVIALPGRAEVGLAQHIAVLRAMRRGDAVAAETLRRANILSARKALGQFRACLL